MKCQNCGNQNQDGDAFCGECGMPISPPNAPSTPSESSGAPSTPSEYSGAPSTPSEFSGALSTPSEFSGASFTPSDFSGAPFTQTQPGNKKKKLKWILIPCISLAVALSILATVFVCLKFIKSEKPIFVFGNNNTTNNENENSDITEAPNASDGLTEDAENVFGKRFNFTLSQFVEKFNNDSMENDSAFTSLSVSNFLSKRVYAVNEIKNDVPWALYEMSFTNIQGESTGIFLQIIGESDSGKITLINLVCKSLAYWSGMADYNTPNGNLIDNEFSRIIRVVGAAQGVDDSNNAFNDTKETSGSHFSNGIMLSSQNTDSCYMMTYVTCTQEYSNSGSEWIKEVALKIVPEFTVEKPASEWNLLLVNKQNPLDASWAPPALTSIGSGYQVDSRIVPDYNNMIAAAKADGVSLKPISAFRSRARQEENFNKRVAKVKKSNPNYTQEQAENEAANYVARPGTSEHETGLAIDFNSVDAENFFKTAESQWLISNAYKYGFILRYSMSDTDITGYSYQPEHYRYVGINHATEMYHSGMCLETYLNR